MSDETNEEAKVRFLCGCQPAVSALTPLTQDDDLYVLCPTHMVRRYGWRSPLNDQYRAFPWNLANPHYVMRPNWGRSNQDNEIEFWNRLGIDILTKAIEGAVAEGKVMTVDLSTGDRHRDTQVFPSLAGLGHEN